MVGSVALWCFFAIQALDYQSEWWGGFGVVVVPIVVAFYIIGWKQNKKKNDEEYRLFGSLFSTIFIHSKKFIVPALILLVGIGGLVWFINYNQGGVGVSGLNNVRQDQLDEYVGRFHRMPQHIENAQQCQDDLVDRTLPVRLSACQSRYERVYDDYQRCRQQYFTFSHLDCLQFNDYERIKCSEELLTSEIISSDHTCYGTAEREYNYLVNFEKRLINNYLSSLPANKYSLTAAEMQQIYNLLPSEAFNAATKERFDEHVRDQGYTIQ